jgi:hypothetical protein
MRRHQLVIDDMPFHRNDIQPRRSGLAVVVGVAVGIWTQHARAEEPVASTSPQLSLEDLSETRNRPLFSPSRRPRVNNVEVAVAPPPPPPAPTLPPLPPPNLTLLGIFESATEVGATVQLQPSDKPVIVRYGTIIGGWRVINISHHQLVLALNDRQAVFKMFNPPGTSNSESADAPQPIGPQFHPAPGITPIAPPRSR